MVGYPFKKIPNSKKTKKEIADKVLSEMSTDYDFKQEVNAPLEELLAIETQSSVKGITNLDEMARLVDIVNSNIIKRLCNYNRSAIYIDAAVTHKFSFQAPRIL